ncbi:Oidioi.mRNA.OKI2018_I69.PAR.g10816.t1.cds [Oikopleura dioica]|uniref:Oidioi.mRNA.OKI2018_I69.PAR.g10816.t1.cds n=1 Tax=Oikopleura dioica TaxID=34765 RepID=A0ABN7RWU8_OIKDI|nr:Oidioi.mRNA.OKI2018_I69.PAR.g10816.t1.cds [Oikopleura dioica]
MFDVNLVTWTSRDNENLNNWTFGVAINVTRTIIILSFCILPFEIVTTFYDLNVSIALFLGVGISNIIDDLLLKEAIKGLKEDCSLTRQVTCSNDLHTSYHFLITGTVSLFLGLFFFLMKTYI